MNIGFTGHRDCYALEADLDKIATEHPGAIWIHGGAKGFDRQVDLYAAAHNIVCLAVPPDYATHDKAAPLVRNRQIVHASQLIVACWDGRTTGGTYYTMQYAIKRGLVVVSLYAGGTKE